MATGLAIGVTVVGVAAILALFGLLARQLGLWAWALNWVRATKEEKTKLCRQERNSSSRSYMDQNNGFEDHQRREHRFFYKLDNDLDWINLWPRSGSYKRFSNLDDVGSDDSQLRMGSTMIPDPSIPPQPLRPAPGPPHRMCGREDGGLTNPFSFAGAGMMMGMMMRDHGVMPHRGVDMTRPIPMLDRRDSNRSMNARFRSSPGQDYSADIIPSTMGHNTSTNPFRSGSSIDYSMYNHHYPNPFASSYSYPGRSHPFLSIEEENRINHSLIQRSSRVTYPSNMERSEHLYSPKSYEGYSRISPLHTQSLDMARDRVMSHNLEEDLSSKYRYTPEMSPSSSQIAYNHSLNQALMKKRSLQQPSIHQHRYLNRYDKIKEDEERIREEERILNQLRYENDLMRRERYESSLKGNSPFSLTALNSNLYDLSEATRDLERESISDNLAYDYQRGASDLREELQKRMLYDMRAFSSLESRDSPPPPAPDVGSSLNYSDSLDSSPKEKFIDWRDRLSRNGIDIPATPPNTAALTPPNSASIPTEQRRSSLVDPYTNSLLQERLAEIEALRYKESELQIDKEKAGDSQERNHQENQALQSLNVNDEAMNYMYHNVITDEREDIGGELTQKLHALQEGKGPDVYPKSLKERIEKRREKEGSRRKRKRERELERKGSLRQMRETMKAIEKSDMDPLPVLSNSETQKYVSPTDNKSFSIGRSESGGKVSCEQGIESALINVPININREPAKDEMSSREQTEERETIVMNKDSSQMLSINNQTNRNLGGSPVVPRKSFLSYKGSWTLESNGNEENQMTENEDDPDRKRVREYIASLSARLQQLPDKTEEEEENIAIKSPPPAHTPTHERFSSSAVIFPTPPNSAARTNSQSSSETPSSTTANWGSVHSWRGSTETPPHSATIANSQSSSDISSNASGNWSVAHSWRGSTETPPSSAGVIEENSKPLYSETPPSSAGYYPPTPPNSASSHFSETPPPSAGYSATPPNSGGLNGSFDLGQAGGQGTAILMRAVSCDSVSSDTSVTLGELEDEAGQITGYLSVEVIYECDTQDLEVVVLEARDLLAPDPNTPVDSYVRVFLLPDKSTNMQTRVAKRSNNPSYRERFLFALEEDEALDRSLSFYMYATDKFTNTMIGEAQLKLADLDFTSSDPIELVLTDSGQKGIGYGEIMFSLSYLPTAERLTVVIVKAKGLVYGESRASADPFVKNIQLRVTVAEYTGDHCLPIPVGHVIVGTQATGKALSHWNQMMSSLRKPIGMWHALRR